MKETKIRRIGREMMKTKLLDGEVIFKKISGVLSRKGDFYVGLSRKGICYVTDRRLIFEEEDKEKVDAEVAVNWKKLLKRSVIGGALLGPLGGGMGGASSVETRVDRSIIPGRTSTFWLDDLTELRLGEKKIEAKFRTPKEQIEQVRFTFEKSSERLTNEEQEKLKALVETAKETARQREKELATLEEMELFLTENYAKQGYINPELRLESCVNEKMHSGKTREKALEELYEETKREKKE